MKKFFSVPAIVGVMMAVAIGASAAPETGPVDTTSQLAANAPQRISGQNDQRLITPDMNIRERMEVQSALKKRALAKRNQLIQAARSEEEQEERTNIPAQPKMK